MTRWTSLHESDGRHPYVSVGAAERSSALGPAKRILTSETDELVFSLVSLWEIAIKIRLGKLNAVGSSVAYIRDEMKEYSMEILPLRYEHILSLESLPVSGHKDPFDRLLVAQALSDGLPVLTADEKFKDYGVKVIW